MARILLWTLLILNNITVFSQGYRIKGTISPTLNGRYIYLYGIDYSGQNPKINDSSLISNGQFNFQGKLNTPALLASLYLKDFQLFFTQFFVENKEMQLNAILHDSTHPVAKLQVRNNPVTNQYTLWKQQTDSLSIEVLRRYPLLDSLERVHADGALADSVKDVQQHFKDQLLAIKCRYITAHPKDYLSLFWLRYDLAEGLCSRPSQLDSIFSILSPALRNLPEGKELQKQMLTCANLLPGKQLPDIQVPDSSGKMVQLRNFEGRYLLIDFWASWCGPCVEAIPELKELYATWLPKGLAIISVSLDKDRKRWLDAVYKYQLPWRQVSDLKGWKSPAAQSCNVHAIPGSILIDKKGKIVAINGDLSKLLPALLN